MASRYMHAPQAEYVEQYTPDIYDPQLFMEAAKHKQERYDVALTAAGEGFIDFDYINLGEQAAAAQEKIQEYKARQDEIIQNLTSTKDSTVAAREIVRMRQDYFNDPTIKQLSKNAESYKLGITNIMTGKDANMNSALLQRYNQHIAETPVGNEITGFNELPEAVFGNLPDADKAAALIKQVYNSNVIPIYDRDKAGNIIAKIVYDENGNPIKHDLVTGTQEYITKEEAREHIKGFLSNNSEWFSSKKPMDYAFGEGTYDRMIEGYSEYLANMLAHKKTNLNHQLFDPAKGDDEGLSYNPFNMVEYTNNWSSNTTIQMMEDPSNAGMTKKLEEGRKALAINKPTEYNVEDRLPIDVAAYVRLISEAYELLDQNIPNVLRPYSGEAPEYKGVPIVEAFEEVDVDWTSDYWTKGELDNENSEDFRNAFLQIGTIGKYNTDFLLTGQEINMFLEEKRKQLLDPEYRALNNIAEEDIEKELQKAKIGLQEATNNISERNAAIEAHNRRQIEYNEIVLDTYKRSGFTNEEIISISSFNKLIEKNQVGDAIKKAKEIIGNNSKNYKPVEKIEKLYINEEGELLPVISPDPIFNATSPKKIIETLYKNQGEEGIKNLNHVFRNLPETIVGLKTDMTPTGFIIPVEVSKGNIEYQAKVLIKFGEIERGELTEDKDNKEYFIAYEEFKKLDNIDNIILESNKRIISENVNTYLDRHFGEKKNINNINKKIDDEIAHRYTSVIKNIPFINHKDPGKPSVTADVKKAWIESGKMDIVEDVDTLRKSFDDPIQATSFLMGADFIIDSRSGKDLKAEIFLRKGVQTIIENEESKKLGKGAVVISNLKYTYGGMAFVPGIGNTIKMTVSFQKEKDGPIERRDYIVGGPKANELAAKRSAVEAIDEIREYGPDVARLHENELAKINAALKENNGGGLAFYPIGYVRMFDNAKQERIDTPVYISILPNEDSKLSYRYTMVSYTIDEDGKFKIIENVDDPRYSKSFTEKHNITLPQLAREISYLKISMFRDYAEE